MTALRRLIYRLGLRPKSGSIFYSPSLDWKHAAWNYYEGMAAALKRDEP